MGADRNVNRGQAKHFDIASLTERVGVQDCGGGWAWHTAPPSSDLPGASRAARYRAPGVRIGVRIGVRPNFFTFGLPTDRHPASVPAFVACIGTQLPPSRKKGDS